MDVNFSLFRGLEINMESLKSLAFGGIAFATPADPKDSPAKDGSLFPLHDKQAKEWLEWAPKLVTAKQSSETDLKPVVQKSPLNNALHRTSLALLLL